MPHGSGQVSARILPGARGGTSACLSALPWAPSASWTSVGPGLYLVLGPEHMWPVALVELGPRSAGEVEDAQVPHVRIFPMHQNPSSLKRARSPETQVLPSPAYLSHFWTRHSPESWSPGSQRWRRPRFWTGPTPRPSRGPRAAEGQTGRWTWRGHHCSGRLRARHASGTGEDTVRAVRTETGHSSPKRGAGESCRVAVCIRPLGDRVERGLLARWPFPRTQNERLRGCWHHSECLHGGPQTPSNET